MSETDKGVLIYSEWFRALDKLSAKDYKAVLSAAYRYQILGQKPPEFSGKAEIVASIIFPYIERRIKQTERGRMGGAARVARLRNSDRCTAKEDAEDHVKVIETDSSHASSQASSHASSQASSQRIEENSIKENSIEEYKIKENTADADARVGNVEPLSRLDDAEDAEGIARAEREKEDLFEENGDGSERLQEGRSGYGTYKNVRLSTEEYLKIKRKIKNADRYIDTFSQKLYTKGYRYPDHAKAILDWWKRDCEIEKRSEPTEENLPEGSFDTDEFFAAAVRRSLGEDAVI